MASGCALPSMPSGCTGTACSGYVRLAYYALSGLHAFDRARSNDFRLAALRLQLPVHLDRLAATLAGEPIT